MGPLLNQYLADHAGPPDSEGHLPSAGWFVNFEGFDALVRGETEGPEAGTPLLGPPLALPDNTGGPSGASGSRGRERSLPGWNTAGGDVSGGPAAAPVQGQGGEGDEDEEQDPAPPQKQPRRATRKPHSPPSKRKKANRSKSRSKKQNPEEILNNVVAIYSKFVRPLILFVRNEG